jgi:hypothetical protein
MVARPASIAAQIARWPPPLRSDIGAGASLQSAMGSFPSHHEALALPFCGLGSCVNHESVLARKILPIENAGPIDAPRAK